jgi:hypothetical protein
MRRIFHNKHLQREFEEHGYVKIPLLNDEQIRHLLQVERRLSPQMQENFYTSIWSDNPDYRKTVDRELKDFYPALLNDLLIYCKPVFGNFLVKKPGENSNIALHQDWTFVDENRFHGVNVWCPLVDTTEQNGQLRIVPDSHKLNLPVRGRAIPSPFKKISEYIFENYATGISAKAGEIVIYDVRLLHGSMDNNSNQNRTATALVMVPDEAKLIHYMKDLNEENKAFKIDVEPEFFTDYGLSDYPQQFTEGKEPVPLNHFILNKEEFDHLYKQVQQPVT